MIAKDLVRVPYQILMIMVDTPTVRSAGASAMFVRVTVASRVTSDDVNGELLRAETARPGPGWMRAHMETLPARTVVRERLKVLPGKPGPVWIGLRGGIGLRGDFCAP